VVSAPWPSVALPNNTELHRPVAPFHVPLSHCRQAIPPRSGVSSTLSGGHTSPSSPFVCGATRSTTYLLLAKFSPSRTGAPLSPWLRDGKPPLLVPAYSV